MLNRVIRHEWRMLTSDSALAVLAAVIAVSLAYGFLNGVRWRTVQATAFADAQQEERARVETSESTIRTALQQKKTLPSFSDPGNPDTAGRNFAARYAAMPPVSLAPLAVGQSDLLPSSYKVTTESKDTLLGASETENPTRLLTGRFDVAFVIIYLYPLFILTLTYNLLSQEREQGTLALVLSQPMSIGRLIAVKVGLRFLLFVVFIVALTVAASLVLGVAGGDAATWMRFGLWAAVVAVYGLFWFVTAIVVAAFGFSSAMNALVLSALWLTLTVLLPSASNVLAMSLYPVPSRVEMIQAIREASDGATAEGASLLGKYYQDHPEFASDTSEQAVTDFNMVKLAVDERIDEQVRPVSQRFDAQLAQQQRLIDRVRFLSPALLAQEALNDISGTGVARHRHFLAQVTAFHTEWRQYFARLIAQKERLADYANVPVFRFSDEPLGAVVARTGVNLASLLLVCLLLAVVAVVRLRRYPIVGE